MDEALARLPEALRRVVTAIYIDHMSLEKIARINGYTKAGLQKKLNRMLDRYL